MVERPVAGQDDPIADARYYNQADVRVLVDAANNVTIKIPATSRFNASSTGNNLALYKVFLAAIHDQRFHPG